MKIKITKLSDGFIYMPPEIRELKIDSKEWNEKFKAYLKEYKLASGLDEEE